MKTAYCFDLDGTLTNQEILPLIASSVGLEDEIGVLTEATINGYLPFDKSFKLRVKLLKDADVDWIHRVLSEEINLQPQIIDFIFSHIEESFVVTGNLDLWVKSMLDDLNIQSFTSTARMCNDKLDGVETVLHKGDAVSSLRDRFDRIVVVGDGMNDVSMFEVADWRIAFGGVHPPHKQLISLSDFVVYDGVSLCRLLNTL
ncbi:HAD family phosphatase [Methylicorpusculum oleiharenae]|uniref:HAD-IB family phosphatase n=1 Tax=Methylicorpusculum oleiharenae TaxID=1338687 RepID=UPI00135AF0C1|nr:HAD family phosphatase [Methylicorpusculum oleiharenae]MCD2449101.1 HAD family phosphatase [Methylicorpusculum oleiharenae]